MRTRTGPITCPMFRQPVLVFQGNQETLTTSHERALTRGIPMSVFTAELSRDEQ